MAAATGAPTGNAADVGPVLSCGDLRKSFGTLTAVGGVGFAIASGEAYGLLGPNGAGKTTVISMVCGLLAPDGGSVSVDGQRVAVGRSEGKHAIGLVPQSLALYDDLSARENLALFGRLQGLRGAALRERVAATLELVGLTERAGDRIETFSGGMKRRTSIGIGLLHEPRLLVLDEPTVGVDPQSRNAILEQVADLTREGTALLYTSHYMEEVERVCDRVGIVDHGALIAEGTTRELVDSLGADDQVSIEASGDLATLAARVRALDGVRGVDATDQGLAVVCASGRELLPRLVAEASGLDVALTGVEVTEPDLEAVFLTLTGRALRD